MMARCSALTLALAAVVALALARPEVKDLIEDLNELEHDIGTLLEETPLNTEAEELENWDSRTVYRADSRTPEQLMEAGGFNSREFKMRERLGGFDGKNSLAVKWVFDQLVNEHGRVSKKRLFELQTEHVRSPKRQLLSTSTQSNCMGYSQKGPVYKVVLPEPMDVTIIDKGNVALYSSTLLGNNLGSTMWDSLVHDGGLVSNPDAVVGMKQKPHLSELNGEPFAESEVTFATELPYAWIKCFRETEDHEWTPMPGYEGHC